MGILLVLEGPMLIILLIGSDDLLASISDEKENPKTFSAPQWAIKITSNCFTLWKLNFNYWVYFGLWRTIVVAVILLMEPLSDLWLLPTVVIVNFIGNAVSAMFTLLLGGSLDIDSFIGLGSSPWGLMCMAWIVFSSKLNR